ncbi:hypothetical protein ACA910_000211 [Epithemia clementina (nom. ined.)]
MALNLSQGSDDYRPSSSSQQRRHHSSSTNSNNNKLTIDLETIQHWWNGCVEYSIRTVRNRVRLDTLRPLPMFMGISANNSNNNSPASLCCLATEAFNPPVKHLDKSTLEKVKSRLSLNFAFFLTNYVLVALVVATVVALMHPSMLLFVGILYGLWAGHNAWGDYHVHMFGVDLNRFLAKSIRVRVLTTVTMIVVVWKCLWPVITALLITALIVMTHAFLRDPKHIELGNNEETAVHSDTNSSSGGHEQEDAEGGLYNGDNMSESAVLVERPGSKSTIMGTTSVNSRSSSHKSSGRGDVI